MYKKFFSALTSIIIFCSLTVSVYANSAQTHWQGTDASGIIITDSNCPVTVKNEVLTFNIDAFPENYYKSQEEMQKYNSFVSAQYTFYNPADYTVTAKLLFPFGEKPMYFHEYYDSETDTYISFDDTAKYDITLNGKTVEKRLRYTLNTAGFDVSAAISKIKDNYVEDEFYYPDMPVVKYTFLVSGVNTEEYHAANAAFDIDKNNSDTKYYFVNQSGYHSKNDTTARVSTWVDNGDKITVYAIGEIPSQFPTWTFYKNGGVEDREKIEGTITLIDEHTMTFYDLAFLEYNKDSGISEVDWYNAVVDSFNTKQNMIGTENAVDIESYLLRWYEYEIEIPAKTEVINTVNAPIYPEINSSYSPAIYDYTYLLSPAKTWADFGTLEININTPFYLVNSDGFSFNKNEGGYTLSLPSLPDTELTFRLSSVQEPLAPEKHITDFVPIEIIIMMGIFAAIIVFTVVTVISVRKIARKRRATKT